MAEREGQLEALELVQRVLAATELAALKANHGRVGEQPARVPRRWSSRGLRRRPAEAAGAAEEPAPRRPRAKRTPPAAPEPERRPLPEAVQALFAGEAWRAHLLGRGPGWVACLRCGGVDSGRAGLAGRPCPGWAAQVPARVVSLALLGAAARVGGDAGEYAEAVAARLAGPPWAPD